MEQSISQPKYLSSKKSLHQPYTFPQTKLIISINQQDFPIKPQEKSVIEEETTCLSKPAPTFSHDLSYVSSSKKLSIGQAPDLQILSNLLRLKIQAKKLQQGLIKNKDFLLALESENTKLSLHKENLHQKLRMKLSKSKNKHVLCSCFLLRSLFN